MTLALFEMSDFIDRSNEPKLDCGKHTEYDLDEHVEECLDGKCQMCGEPVGNGYGYWLNHYRVDDDGLCTSMMLIRNQLFSVVRSLRNGELRTNCHAPSHKHADYNPKGVPVKCAVDEYWEKRARLLAAGVEPEMIPEFPEARV